MSRVAEGHFRRKREAPFDIEGKHVTIQGPSPDLSPASPLSRLITLPRPTTCGRCAGRTFTTVHTRQTLSSGLAAALAAVATARLCPRPFAFRPDISQVARAAWERAAGPPVASEGHCRRGCCHCCCKRSCRTQLLCLWVTANHRPGSFSPTLRSPLVACYRARPPPAARVSCVASPVSE